MDTDKKKDTKFYSASKAEEKNRNKNLQGGLSEKFIPDEIMDILLEEVSSTRTVDTQTYIAETQARVWKALKIGLQFEATTQKSERFLRKHVNSKHRLVILYADLVGSTRMSQTLPVDRLATIIQTFTQEMSFAISNFDGYLLKYVGDAVIAYFPAEQNFYLACDATINCARSMITILQQGINPVLNQYDYPELQVKIGIDAGDHAIIQYGRDAKSHVDILGYTISIASKITGLAQPNQVVVSGTVYNGTHPSLRKKFSALKLDRNVWNYIDENTGEIYHLYAFNG
ncbi:MAG: adenylate/guanylate cyclase domain-containing protein [Nitrososphaerales archaeon]